MKILIACVGKMKEKHFILAQEEYLKRLSRFAKVEVYEAAEEKIKEDSQAFILQGIAEEGRRLIYAARGYDYYFALSPEGNKKDSLKFAQAIRNITINGKNSVCFFIGGSYGLSNEVKEICQEILSFSDMTFAHQLFRIMLLEQIYRAFKINSNEIYHK